MFLGNYGIISGMMIYTKVGSIEHRVTSHNLDPANLRAFQTDKLTIEELVNSVFDPSEQVNDSQAHLLGTILESLSGGPATLHIGTGTGGSTSHQSRWDGKDPNDRPRQKRRQGIPVVNCGSRHFSRREPHIGMRSVFVFAFDYKYVV